MINNNRSEKIAIWGTGEDGKWCYQKFVDKYDIVCFVDNNPSLNGVLFGKKVYSSTGFFNSEYADYMIVIATTRYMEDIISQLEDMGKEIGRDFIPFDYFDRNMIEYLDLRKRYIEKDSINIIRYLKKGRKIAAVYGNCQTAVLARILSGCPDFYNEYFLVLIPEVWRFADGKLLPLIKEAWGRECSIFLCQHVLATNKFDAELSTENIISYLPVDCETIFITNAFFLGYFPQCQSEWHNVDMCLHQSGRFQYGDKFIDEMMQNGHTADYVLKKLLDEEFIHKDEVMRYAEQSLKELEERENKCDVGIVDYLRQNYSERQLFLAPNHPVNEVLWELSKRILEFLSIPVDDFNYVSSDIEELNSAGVPLYPCVIKGLGLKKIIPIVYANRGLWEFKSDVRGFLRKYMRTCWGK